MDNKEIENILEKHKLTIAHLCIDGYMSGSSLNLEEVANELLKLDKHIQNLTEHIENLENSIYNKRG